MRQRLERSEYDKEFYGVKGSPDDLVFSHAQSGRSWSPDEFTRAVPKYAELAGLGHVRLHDLRHTPASIMLKAGVHLKVVQERLGHSTIATTADIYSHIVPGLQRDAIDRFAEELERGTEGA